MGHRRGSPFWIGADFRITGDGQPDPNGYYFDAGKFGGKQYYERQDAAFVLWWRIIMNGWAISEALDEPTNYWYHIDPDPEGTYDPQGTPTGNPVVACMDGCNPDEADEAQTAYLEWSAAHPDPAARGRPNRNAWLKKHGRDQHVT